MTIRTEYFAILVAVVTDASGECRKARRILAAEYTNIIFLDCYAHQVCPIFICESLLKLISTHQINLVVGDYFKSNASVLDFTDRATELIAWLRSKTQLLALLRAIHARLGKNAAKTVIRAVLTRWTAHYQAYARLLDLRFVLVIVVTPDKDQPENEMCIFSGDAKAKKKAKEMVALINNDDFWKALTRYSGYSSFHAHIFDSWISRMKLHLRPLAIAANVTQAAFCCLDTVLLTFGFLIMQYQKMTDEADRVAATSIISSLEKRWMAADQDVFIATVIVNPFFRADPLGHHPRFVVAGIIELLGRLYTRFFKEEPPYNFGTELRDYLTTEGQYSELHATCFRHKMTAKQQVCPIFMSSSCPKLK